MPRSNETRTERRENEKLIEAVNSVISNRIDNLEIGPSWVATEAAKKLRNCRLVMKKAPDFYLGCHLQLRQIARAHCRALFEPDSGGDTAAQHPLFPDLQWRYPRRPQKGAEPQYILTDHIDDDDIDYNIERLRAEGNAKLAHADSLEAFKLRRAHRRRAG